MLSFLNLKNFFSIFQNFTTVPWNILSGPILLLMILSMMVLPLSPWILDLFFTFNIVLSLIIVLVSMFTKRTLDFSSFPTILLFSTLLRLALNVATTRIILLDGHTGSGSAGQVIQSFGHFLVGGNFAIGMVVFIILVIINFMVITKGAGRVAEVGARFALDGMPGKQMAIDADLNAGLIGESEAKKRRLEVASEADFYGSMDGASKFVRGDAIAGILIMIINVLGGLVIGVMQHGMPIKQAAEVYTLLTIGDGLVAQIPALVISTATGVIVTRVTTKKNVGNQMIKELFNNPQIILLSGVILGTLGLVPGMPSLVFLFFSGFLFLLSFYLYKKSENSLDLSFHEKFRKSKESFFLREATWDDVRLEDQIRIELGEDLSLVFDESKKNNFLLKIRAIRKRFAQDIGFLPPVVNVQKNEQANPVSYKIFIKGIKIAEGQAFTNKLVAIDSGIVKTPFQKKFFKEPVLGMKSIWIKKNLEEEAKRRGYVAIDGSSYIVAHLNAIMNKSLHELFGRQETQKLLDRVRNVTPDLVEDFIPNFITLTSFHKVLQNLLLERVPIRDMRTIIETIIENTRFQNKVKELTDCVRISLRKYIVQRIFNNVDFINVRILDRKLESRLLKFVQDGKSIIEPELSNYIVKDITRSILENSNSNIPTVIIVHHSLRLFFSLFCKAYFEEVYVLSNLEIGDQKNIKILDVIGSSIDMEKDIK